MVDRKIPDDETPEQRATRERQEERNQEQSQQSRERVAAHTDALPEDMDSLPPETQEEVRLGAERVATYANAGLPEQDFYQSEVPGLTTEDPGTFIGQESAASPVGTEPNPPEGVTALSHTPIDPAAVTDLEDQGLDAKERKALYEAQHSRAPGDTRPAAEIANEIQEQKDRDLEQSRKNRGVDPATGRSGREKAAADTRPLAERIAAAKTPKSEK